MSAQGGSAWGGKKNLLLLLAVIMVFAFAGCSLTDKLMNKAGEKIGEKIVEKATNSEIDTTNNSITINTNEGTASFGEDLSLPKDFPSDVPVFEKANVVSSSSTASDNSFYITMLASDDYISVDDYYSSELEAQGWTIDNSSSYNTDGLQSTTYICSKDNRDLTIGLYESDDGVGNKEVSIAISLADKPAEE